MTADKPEQDDNSLSQLVLDTLIGIAPDIDPSALDPDVAFRDQFEIDSVDFLNFVIGLEKRLGRRIPESDFPRLSSLKGCLDYLGAEPA
ncbi:MAG: acyl carrier protein [Chromatiaceae bacterium]